MRIRPNLRLLSKALLVGIISVVALSACQTISSAGKGELYLSNSTKRGLKAYMDKFNPTIFAASMDGRQYSYYYCDGDACRDPSSTFQGVVDSCNKRSKTPCKVLAAKRQIVWMKSSGEKYTLAELNDPSVKKPISRINTDIATLGAVALCGKAYDPKQKQWSAFALAQPYVKESKQRGFTSDFCAKMVSAAN